MSHQQEDYSNTCERTYTIEVLNPPIDLQFHQLLEGDVNCVIWDASIVLAKYLEVLYENDENFLKNKNVLELGAGLGLVGFVAAALGANVLSTDLGHAIGLLSYNFKANEEILVERGSVRIQALEWGAVDHLKSANFEYPDKILLSDCIYYEEGTNALVQTLIEYSDEETEIIMVQENRSGQIQEMNRNIFFKQMARNFERVIVPLEVQNVDFRSEEIQIFKFYKI